MWDSVLAKQRSRAEYSMSSRHYYFHILVIKIEEREIATTRYSIQTRTST